MTLAAALSDICEATTRLGVPPSDAFWAFQKNPELKRKFKDLENAISLDDVIGPIVGKFVIGPSGGGPANTMQLAYQLATRVLSGTSVDVAILDLQSFVREPSIAVQTIYCLTGVTVAADIRLDDRISLRRPESLPDTPQRQRMFSDAIQAPTSTGLEMLMETPTAALVWHWTINPAIVEPAAAISGTWGADHKAESDSLGRALAAVVLSCAGPMQRSHRYHEVSAPGFPGVGQAWSPGLALGMPGREPNTVDAARCKRFYEQANKFNDWEAFQRLVNRYSRARIRGDRVDAHLDFGIVAESLLTHESGETGELRYRLANRAAWLLGSSLDERQMISRKMRRLYDLRSAAAHEGRLPDSGKKKWTRDDLSEAAQLCEELLRRTLENGAFITDWDEITLGGA